ncbi:hypothetical protein [Candidatus Avelusimicrobium alvi]|uniref:hypothetical protein n=1 Tax=Candidatus Avelusimicrobium alvi TaxID=3416221 RepID=UPI003D0AF9FA
MEWITTHWDDVLTIIGGVVVVVSAVVKLTSTTKDDTVWAKILKVLSALSLVNPDGSVIGKKADK